jgi:3-phosphoshikimate 1-carboxyvinyltransferase
MKLLPYQGVVSLSGSKSSLQRYMFMASLTQVRTILTPGSICADVLEMANALKATGAEADVSDKEVYIDSLGTSRDKEIEVKFQASATALRFWLARSITSRGKTTILIAKQLFKRPLQPFLKTLADIGCGIKLSESGDNAFQHQVEIFPGVDIHGTIEVDSKISSQFISGLMMVAPYLKNGLRIRFKQEPVSYSYLEMTRRLMQKLKVKAELDYEGAAVLPDEGYIFPELISVEPDMSSAAFFLVLGAFSEQGIVVGNIPEKPVQPDSRITDILGEMGVGITHKNEKIISKAGCLKSIDMGLENNPDLFPVLACLALFADKPSILRNVSRLQHKESDRISGMLRAFDLLKAGYEYSDGNLKIHPLENNPEPVVLDTRDDHRLVMAFTLLSLHFPQVSLSETASVAKSCPCFLELLDSLKIVNQG